MNFEKLVWQSTTPNQTRVTSLAPGHVTTTRQRGFLFLHGRSRGDAYFSQRLWRFIANLGIIIRVSCLKR